MTTMIVSKTFIKHFKAEMLQRNPTYGYVQLLWLSWILHVMVGNRRIKIICPTFCFLVYAPLIMVYQVIDFFFFFILKTILQRKIKGGRGRGMYKVGASCPPPLKKIFELVQ